MPQESTISTNQQTQQPQAPHVACGERLPPGEAAMEYFKEYAKERPEVVAMWAFGVGFVLGWKLKPW